jgi:hypothetical protein
MRSMPPRSKQPSLDRDFDKLISLLRARYDRLGPSSSEREAFLAHVQSLARWHEEPSDYPRAQAPRFLESLHVAYAVCHPECGAREFIVDGSTQECSHCGGSMFRSDTAEYRLAGSPRRHARARRPKARSSGAPLGGNGTKRGT